MKKVICSAAAVALLALAVTSCNKQAPKVDEKPVSTSSASSDMKIAYIEVDSIMTQYKFCKEYSLILERKVRISKTRLTQKAALCRMQ